MGSAGASVALISLLFVSVSRDPVHKERQYSGAVTFASCSSCKDYLFRVGDAGIEPATSAV